MGSRREFLLTAGAAALSGCATPCAPPALPGAPDAMTALIDGHCHLFNVTDLSATRFLSYVILKHYPPLEQPRPAARAFALAPPQDPDWADDLMGAVLALVGADATPDAATERRLLETGRALGPKAQDPAAIREATIQRAGQLLANQSFTAKYPKGEAHLRLLIRQAGSPPQAGAEAPPHDLDMVMKAPPTPDAAAVARRALSHGTSRQVKASTLFSTPAPIKGQQALPPPLTPAESALYLPGLIDFVVQLKRYRHCITDQLTEIHRDDGQNPLLLAPAMVDFGRWLRQEPQNSFLDQAKTWNVISRRKGGPAVHGYIAWCPLRQAQHKLGVLGKFSKITDDPMDVVKAALTEHGFLGVKLYPPMGFRASDNASRNAVDHPMPVGVLNDCFGGTGPLADSVREQQTGHLGALLDEALNDLWNTCVELGAPVMAHGGNSVAANCETGELADPYYWRNVFDRAQPPRVMLAHFGGFAYRSADPHSPDYRPPKGVACTTDDSAPAPFADTWEAWLANYMTTHADRPVFTDLSYFSEVLAGGTVTQEIRDRFKAFDTATLDLLSRRLVFGTDWTMLAREDGVPRYSTAVRNFVVDIFGASRADDIMRRNFLTYAGLAPGGPTFQRIARVYGGDPALIARLEAACRA
ncbi:hypothetical protein [Phenylobacterium sp.]|jgi:predicted TIM-barrel fold metal-dependent hydrolase|uniref:hypothetical protein n=1 Tax=Phenylobacterium sp. TaxID=1871053 RepID=UPI002F429C0D